MNELVGKSVRLRNKEEAEHIRIHRQSGKVFPEEGFFFDVNADHDDIIICTVSF